MACLCVHAASLNLNAGLPIVGDRILKAFVLIRIGEKRAYPEDEYKRRISGINGVKEVYRLFGQYDFIAAIQADNIDEIAKIVDHEIRTIAGVHSTETFIAY